MNVEKIYDYLFLDKSLLIFNNFYIWLMFKHVNIFCNGLFVLSVIVRVNYLKYFDCCLSHSWLLIYLLKHWNFFKYSSKLEKLHGFAIIMDNDIYSS